MQCKQKHKSKPPDLQKQGISEGHNIKTGLIWIYFPNIIYDILFIRFLHFHVREH